MMRGACLRELNLDGCSGFGDAAVRMLCRACPGLLELSLQGCSAVRFVFFRAGRYDTGFLWCSPAAFRRICFGFVTRLSARHGTCLSHPSTDPPLPSVSPPLPRTLSKPNVTNKPIVPADLPRSLALHTTSLRGNPGDNAHPPAWPWAHPPRKRKGSKTSGGGGRQGEHETSE